MNTLQLSEAVSLAIHSLILLAWNGEKHRKVKELAQEIGVSKAHLAKVFQRLVRVGLVESVRRPQEDFSWPGQKGPLTFLRLTKPSRDRCRKRWDAFCAGRNALLGSVSLEVW